MEQKRVCGILMPISSLPSAEGIGTLGKETFAFLDFMRETGQSVWQVLPLNPTNYGDSPYQSCSSNALNYYFIDLELLAEQKLLTKKEIREADLKGDPRRVDYGKQFYHKIAILKKAFSRFRRTEEFLKFVERGEYADFALFMALKEKFGHKAWIEWDEPYKTYDEEVVAAFQKEAAEEILFWHFTQYIFLEQWHAVQAYAHACGIQIMGDIPLYLAYDSVEMWKYGDKIFRVDEHRTPAAVAGCPPDAFSDDGQLWGNPVYDWEGMKKDGFSWWNARIEDNLKLFDILRIDHFRGFDRYYSIPYGAKNARIGEWVDGPKEALFKDKLNYNIVAEDLGVIDDGVRRLMKFVGYPGMKIMEFAFDGSPRNEHKPALCTENFVAYTGTHDNMPLRQYIDDLKDWERERFVGDLLSQGEQLGVRVYTSSSSAMTRSVIRLAYASRANTVLIPMWDLLAMGGESRINLPSTVSPANWSWRFVRRDFTKSVKKFLKTLAIRFGRVYNIDK